MCCVDEESLLQVRFVAYSIMFDLMVIRNHRNQYQDQLTCHRDYHLKE